MSVPAPATQRFVGHLGRWGQEPLTLLEEGARLGPVFSLRLWRRALVGYSPDWNRLVLQDLSTFRSRGSMSAMSPYLGSGVVQLDAPAHAERRRELNPGFSRQSLSSLSDHVHEIIARRLPTGVFDCVAWSAATMRDILAGTFFGDTVSSSLLEDFLRPLEQPLPAPLWRRPLLFRRMNSAIRRTIDHAPDGSLAAVFRSLPNGVHEMRVALSAGYDTTAHTMAWLLAHTAQRSELTEPAHRDAVINEVLRLYPAGWVGSRRCAREVTFGDVRIAKGTLVLYSPFLTHRDPQLWPDPLTYRPERFESALPAWGFIPFAAGERSCLGRSYARLVLGAVLDVMAERSLSFVCGALQPRAGITLAPSGPIHLKLI